jgi:hypothetical protein
MKKSPGIIEKKTHHQDIYGDRKTEPANCQGYRWLKYVEQGYNIQGSS